MGKVWAVCGRHVALYNFAWRAGVISKALIALSPRSHFSFGMFISCMEGTLATDSPLLEICFLLPIYFRLLRLMWVLE